MAVKEVKTVKKESTKKVVKDVKKAAEAIKEVQTKVPVKIKRLIDKVADLQEQERKISDEKDALKEQIKAYMKEQGVTELLTDDLKAVYSESQRTVFDETGFAKKHPQMYKKYLTFKVKSDKVIESLKVSNITKTQRKK